MLKALFFIDQVTMVKVKLGSLYTVGIVTAFVSLVNNSTFKYIHRSEHLSLLKHTKKRQHYNVTNA